MPELNFDATKVAPSVPMDFGLIKPGDHLVVIVASEIRATKDGNGRYLVLEEEIQDGEFKGRKLWHNLNLWPRPDADPKTKTIAEGQFSALCHAVGVPHVSRTEQLHGKPVIAVVKTRPARGEYEASNEVKGYKPLSERAAQPGVVAGTVQPLPQGWTPPASGAAQPAPAAPQGEPAGAVAGAKPAWMT